MHPAATVITLPSNTIWVTPNLGVAVVPGDRDTYGTPYGQQLITYRPPQEWVQYDKPCETCEGLGFPKRKLPCQSCLGDGRQVWDVRWTVGPVSYTHGMVVSARATIQVVPVVADLEDVGGAYEGPACVEVNPATGHCRYWPAWSGALEYDDGTDLPLDPLPVPGRDWVLVVRLAA